MMQRLFFTFVGIALVLNSFEVCAGSASVIKRSSGYQLLISAQPAAKYRARDLLGVHSLWWGHAEGLFAPGTTETHNAVSSLLKGAGGVIRYGGGANEISWRSCSGAVKERKPVKAVPWAGPMTCRFGIPEYVELVRRAQGDSVWMIANLVGVNYAVSSDLAMASDVGAGALMLADRAAGLKRYWELGNELERGRYRWTSEQIAHRAGVAANAIAERDSSARLILPLIEFDADWQPRRRTFNEQLLKASANLPIAGVALHLYYDGRPGGPSVPTQLRTIEDTSESVERILGKPVELWITEHGRWPEGDSSDPGWKRRWTQTNDLGGVLGTADFLIGLSQIGSVAGAMLHGLRAGPWNVVDVVEGNPQPSGVGQLLALFGQTGAVQRLVSHTSSRNESGYAGGYDFRGAAFLDESGEHLIAWIVNRSNAVARVRVGFPVGWPINAEMDGRSLVCVRSTDECRGSDFRTIAMTPTQFTASEGQAYVSVPALSVSALKFRVNR